MYFFEVSIKSLIENIVFKSICISLKIFSSSTPNKLIILLSLITNLFGYSSRRIEMIFNPICGSSTNNFPHRSTDHDAGNDDGPQDDNDHNAISIVRRQ